MALDTVNCKWDRGMLCPLATAREASEWRMRQEPLSPSCTASWDEILDVLGG